MATTQTTAAPVAGALDEERAPAPRRRRDDRALPRAGRALKVLAVALIAGAIGYATGRLQMTARVDRAWAEHADQLAAEAREQRTIEERAVELARDVQLLDGARQISRAERALEARNFGIAEARLREAESTLRELGDAVPGAPALASQVGSTRILVAEDVASQRDRLISLAERADALIEQRGPLVPQTTEENPR